MDYAKERLAAQAIRKAVMLMQRTAPGLIQVYMGVTGIPTDNPEVAIRVGVNGGSPVMEYNVDFVTGLEPSLLGAIVYMECERIALHHCDRRKQEPIDMLKLASDVVVAEYARKLVDTSVGNNLEIVNRLFPSFWNYWPVLQKHGFHPETDLTLEKLFNIFKEEYATMKPEEEDDEEEQKKEQGQDGHKSDSSDKAQSNGSGKDTRPSEGSKDGTENSETSGSPGESDEQGDGKEDGSSGEGGKDKGEEESGDNGDGGQGDSGEGERESGQDAEGDSGESGEGDSGQEQDGNEGTPDGTPEDSGDDSGTPGQGGDGASGEGADGGSEPGDTPGDGASGDGEEGDDGEGNGDDGSPGDTGSRSDEVSGGSASGDTKKDDFESMSRYFSLTNAGNDLEKWGQDDVARDNVTSIVNEALDKGMFDRVRGQLPIMLRNANRVKVDKEAMFRKFMTSLQDDEREDTWSRRNRKFIRYGMIAPGYIYKETQRILFCVDVSGSMYQGNAIANCLTVMENVVNGLSIDLVYWDAVCSPVFNAPKSIRDMAIYGGGRTNPDCVLRKLGPERYKYDGIIFLTDCIFEWRRPPRHKQIMILRTHGEHAFPDWCVYKDDLEKFIGHAA